MKGSNTNGWARRTVDGILAYARETVRHLQKLVRNHRRMVLRQVIKGASYGVGSGAVSLLIIWYERRH